jgi:hypothetical protein
LHYPKRSALLALFLYAAHNAEPESKQKNPRSKRGFIIASSTHRVKLKANDKFLIKELLITQRRR